MIGSLRGELAELRVRGDSAEAVLDVGGVGYRVVLGARTAASLAGAGGPIALQIHTHVRESAIVLYGFATSTELQAFEVLLGAHGVGPALALAMVGMLGPAELTRAVAEGDLATLSRVPGVGRKTAARLLVELGPRLDAILETLPGPSAAIGSPALAHRQVGEALSGLGYAPDEVRAALEALPEEGSIEELLRSALASLAPAR